MRIEDSNLLMVSTRMSVETTEQKEVLRAWVDSKDSRIPKDRLTLSPEAKPCLKSPDITANASQMEECYQRTATLERLLAEVLSGREVRLLDVSQFQRDDGPSHQGSDRVEPQEVQEEEREGWGVEYNKEVAYSDREHMAFVAAGIIRTTDGQEIDFSLRLDMAREFVSRHNLNLRLGDAALTDPLVVNFNGKACELEDMGFSFDLDCDGTLEELPLLQPGSGFLALDLDGDGTITTGKELFGPSTGNGFSELREYDEDGNQWIDENDHVYRKLSVWTIDKEGTRQLAGLREKGIGAIYLGAVTSGFDFRGNVNQLMGQVRNTGLYITENGIPGTVQQLDLAV
jgi:hypothetical protein